MAVVFSLATTFVSLIACCVCVCADVFALSMNIVSICIIIECAFYGAHCVVVAALFSRDIRCTQYLVIDVVVVLEYSYSSTV